MFGIPQVDNSNSSALPWYESLYFEYLGKEYAFTALYKPSDSSRVPDGRALDLFNVRYLVLNNSRKMQREYLEAEGYPLRFEDTLGNRAQVFENLDVMPRAFLAAALRSGPMDLDAVRDTAFTDDAALREAAAKLGVSDAPAALTPGSRADVLEYRNARVRIETHSGAPAVLVLLDAWHPNWRVTVDGAPAHLGLTDGAFRCVALVPGAHEVVMTYRPATLYPALAIAVAALIALVSCAAFVPCRDGASGAQAARG